MFTYVYFIDVSRRDTAYTIRLDLERPQTLHYQISYAELDLNTVDPRFRNQTALWISTNYTESSFNMCPYDAGTIIRDNTFMEADHVIERLR